MTLITFQIVKIIFFILTGALNNMKRNQVKLHDNILKVLQEREEEKKEREQQSAIIMELRNEVKMMVNKFIIMETININIFFYFFFNYLLTEHPKEN